MNTTFVGMIKCTAFCLLAVLIHGCATVKSTPLDKNTKPGLNYFLPSRTVVFSGTRTPQEKEDIQKKIKAATDAKSAAEIQKKEADEIIKKIDTELTGDGLSDDRKKKLSDDKAAATAVKKSDEALIKQKNAEIASLNRVLLQLDSGQCAYSYDIKLETGDVIPDVSHGYVLNVSHNWLRDDAQTLKLTTSGLLTSADVTAIDRSGDILVEAASAISAVQSGGRFISQFRGALADSLSGTCDTSVKSFKYIFDPQTEIPILNTRLSIAEWPFHVDQRSLGSNQNWAAAPSTAISGIYYRTAVPVVISVSQCNKTKCATDADRTPIQGSVVMLPQAGPVSFIPLESSAFVKTIDKATFENGMLIGWETNKPSEVLEIVRLPVKILKAVISIPTELIKLKIDYSTEQKNLEDVYAKQLQSEQTLKVMKECVNAANEADSDPLKCFSE